MFKQNKGFSLVELIIVIAIMAVLVGFLAPQFLKYVEKSRDSKAIHCGDAYREAVEVTIIAIASGNDVNNIGASLSSGYFAFTPTTSISAAPSGQVMRDVVSAMHIGASDRFEAIAIVDNYQVMQVTYRDMNTDKVYVWFLDAPRGNALSSYASDINTWIVFDNAGSNWTSDYAGLSSVQWNGN